MAGYALAKLEITGARIIFLVMLILLMVPLSVLIVPLWTLIHRLGLIDTYWALILPGAGQSARRLPDAAVHPRPAVRT